MDIRVQHVSPWALGPGLFQVKIVGGRGDGWKILVTEVQAYGRALTYEFDMHTFFNSARHASLFSFNWEEQK